MLARRKKQNRKHLDFYARVFRVTPNPHYQVICDANFVHHFVHHQLGATVQDLHAMLAATLDTDRVKMVLCESSLRELEELFGKQAPTYQFAAQMERIRCGKDEAESMAMAPQVSMRKLVGSGFNRRGFLVATQDEEVKEHFRGVAGVPLLYLQRALLLLDAPSPASLHFQSQQEQKKLLVPKEEKKRLREDAAPAPAPAAAAGAPAGQQQHKKKKKKNHPSTHNNNNNNNKRARLSH